MQTWHYHSLNVQAAMMEMKGVTYFATHGKVRVEPPVLEKGPSLTFILKKKLVNCPC